jgi:hypothetical protein
VRFDLVWMLLQQFGVGCSQFQSMDMHFALGKTGERLACVAEQDAASAMLIQQQTNQSLTGSVLLACRYFGGGKQWAKESHNRLLLVVFAQHGFQLSQMFW